MGNSRRARVYSIALSVMLFVICSVAQAQPANRMPRIGYLARRTAPTTSVPDPSINALRKGLRDLGYIEGKNILVDSRYAEGMEDRLPGLAAELLRLNVDVIVSPTLPGIRAAKQATNTIPIVVVTQEDPVATGLIDSLARPGGNITGLTTLSRELSGKRLEVFKEAVPRLSRVGIITVADTSSSGFKEYETAAAAQRLQVQSLEVNVSTRDFDAVFQSAAKGRVNGLITSSAVLLVSYAKRIAELALNYRLPSMYERSGYAEAGGLMSYAASDVEAFRRAAMYVDKILKGAKPADLPVEQPKKFELEINLKTAKQIGLTIPPNVLARADRVIK
jgi:putative ABC transport system substrate-binding protein